MNHNRPPKSTARGTEKPPEKRQKKQTDKGTTKNRKPLKLMEKALGTEEQKRKNLAQTERVIRKLTNTGR